MNTETVQVALLGCGTPPVLQARLHRSAPEADLGSVATLVAAAAPKS